MKHLGDIRNIHGVDVEPVDCVIGGSPCQDLSVAGNQKGLSGERSGLFMEQIRIVKEMRDADIQRGRADEFIRPRYMVWENVPGAFSSNGGNDFRTVLEETIKIAEPAPPVPLPKKWPLADSYYGDGWSVAYRVHDAKFWGVPQQRRRIALVADFGGQSATEILFERKDMPTDSEQDKGERSKDSGAVGGSTECWCFQRNMIRTNLWQSGTGAKKDVSFTLDTQGPHSICELYKRTKYDANSPVNYSHVRRLTPLECERLQGLPDGYTDIGEWIDSKGKTRQSYDAARYKAIGNGIALPFWKWMLKRLSSYCGDNPTMGSLFDGIGSFPLIWEEINGKGTALWASEIDEFAIAVSKYHFPDE